MDSNIDELIINNTNLEDISILGEYKCIEELHLSDNLITDISVLETLPNLEVLDIKNNSINNINIDKYSNLKELYVEGNYNLYNEDLIDYCNDNNIKIDIDEDDVFYVRRLKTVVGSLGVNHTSDVEKERAIYDFVIDYMKYDYRAKENKELVIKYNDDTLYYAMLGNGVCSNYATLFEAMCQVAGINCYEIIGESSDSCHAWNLVEIDGEYMLCDSTYAQNLTLGIGKNKYFNKSGEDAKEFILNHQEYIALNSQYNELLKNRSYMAVDNHEVNNKIKLSHLKDNDIYELLFKILAGVSTSRVVLLSCTLLEFINSRIKEKIEVKKLVK